jgi:hypothetical protein
LIHRRSVENGIVEMFTKNGINALASIDILPPYKKYSDEEGTAILDGFKIETIFSVSLRDTQITTETVSADFINHIGRNVFSEGYSYNYISGQSGDFDLVLSDLKSKNLIWRSTFFSNKIFNGDEHLSRYFTEKIFEMLEEQEIIDEYISTRLIPVEVIKVIDLNTLLVAFNNNEREIKLLGVNGNLDSKMKERLVEFLNKLTVGKEIFVDIQVPNSVEQNCRLRCHAFLKDNRKEESINQIILKKARLNIEEDN